MTSRLTFLVSASVISIGAATLAIAQSGPFDSPVPSGTAPQARSYQNYQAPTRQQDAPEYVSQYVSEYAPEYKTTSNYSYPSADVPIATTYKPSVDPARPHQDFSVKPQGQQASGNYTSQASHTGKRLAGALDGAHGGTYQPLGQFEGQNRAFTDPYYKPNSYAPHALTTAQDTSHRRQPVQYAQAGPFEGGPYSQGPHTQKQPTQRESHRGGQSQKPRSFWDRLGFGNLKFRKDGYVRAGVAALQGDNQAAGADDVEFAVDGMARGEVSAITQGGIEYGVLVKLRGQSDPFREGFGGRAGTCAPGFGDCASVLVAGNLRPVAGHVGQLYNFGDHRFDEAKLSVEGAHLFVRSAYGDVTLGRDDGSAAIFSLGAPSTLPLARSSNSRIDYTGLDMTKTLNDASGFAEKITYTSPRMLGDKIGFGVQMGMSYAPKTEVCGVDYCVEGNNLSASATSAVRPELEDAIELGLAVDRTFANGMSVEGTLTYATASEQSGLAVFDDLQSFGLGLNLGYGDFMFGTSYLSSNNGIASGGDYSAYDIGMTWRPEQWDRWGVTASYGQSQDDLAKAEGRSILLGASYDLTSSFTLGGGVQFSEREQPQPAGTAVGSSKQDSTGLFIEGGWTF